jgi:hypothetical protein
MRTWLVHVKPATSILVAFSCLAFSGPGGADKPGGGQPPLTVTKAVCGPGDHPETDLQGQVSAAKRAAPGGFQGFNCNLALVGQGDGELAEHRAQNRGGSGNSKEKATAKTTHRLRLSRNGVHNRRSDPLVPDGTNNITPPTAYLATTSLLDRVVAEGE